MPARSPVAAAEPAALVTPVGAGVSRLRLLPRWWSTSRARFGGRGSCGCRSGPGSSTRSRRPAGRGAASTSAPSTWPGCSSTGSRSWSAWSRLRGWPPPRQPCPGWAAKAPSVNLEHRDQAELETLPGIGPVTAQAILQWRTDNGTFSAVDELIEVSGIGEATLAEIAPARHRLTRGSPWGARRGLCGGHRNRADPSASTYVPSSWEPPVGWVPCWCCSFRAGSPRRVSPRAWPCSCCPYAGGSRHGCSPAACWRRPPSAPVRSSG